MLQNATPLRKSTCWPPNLTSLMHMSLVLRLPRDMHLPKSSWNVAHLPSFWKCYKTFTFCSLLTRCTIPIACHAKRHLNVQKCSVPFSFLHFGLRNVLRATTACTFSTQLPKVLWTVSFLHFWLWNVLRATTACTFSTSQLPKVVQSWCVLYMFTSKCALRQHGVHFSHLNFQKWAEHEVFCTFGLGNLCTFSTSQLPKVVPTWGVLYIWTWKCASRQNGVHFFDISTSKNDPNVRGF